MLNQMPKNYKKEQIKNIKEIDKIEKRLKEYELLRKKLIDYANKPSTSVKLKSIRKNKKDYEI